MAYVHQREIGVTFGDCDPAGIVYYPNILRWMDGTFHDWLRGFGGHAPVCARLGAMGLGLLSAGASFRRPMRDGDQLTLGFEIANWGRKAVTLRYEGQVGGALTFEGEEVRGVFVETEGGLAAAPMAPLRELVEGHG